MELLRVSYRAGHDLDAPTLRPALNNLWCHPSVLVSFVPIIHQSHIPALDHRRGLTEQPPWQSFTELKLQGTIMPRSQAHLKKPPRTTEETYYELKDNSAVLPLSVALFLACGSWEACGGNNGLFGLGD